MIETKWFISYKTYSCLSTWDLVITDVTPARWVMYHNANKNETCVILYAEEISPALAAELTHSAGIDTEYFKEVE